MRRERVGRSSANCFDGPFGHLMESIGQGADDNSKPFQANGRRQSPIQLNTARKTMGKLIGRQAQGERSPAFCCERQMASEAIIAQDGRNGSRESPSWARSAPPGPVWKVRQAGV